MDHKSEELRSWMSLFESTEESEVFLTPSEIEVGKTYYVIDSLENYPEGEKRLVTIIDVGEEVKDGTIPVTMEFDDGSEDTWNLDDIEWFIDVDSEEDDEIEEDELEESEGYTNEDFSEDMDALESSINQIRSIIDNENWNNYLADIDKEYNLKTEKIGQSLTENGNGLSDSFDMLHEEISNIYERDGEE